MDDNISKIDNTLIKPKVKDWFIKDSKKQIENLRNILQYSNANLIRGKDSAGYLCTFCSRKFKLPAELKSHNISEHNEFSAIRLPKLFEYVLKLDITDLKCKVCNQKFDQILNITDHLKKEHEINIFTDIKCQIVPFKFETDTLRCALCEMEFYNYKILQEHMHVHFRNYVCDICNAGFVTDRLLKNHKRRHGVSNFKCGQCDKRFDCDRKRRDHEQRIHMGLKKKNKCNFCSEKFADYWTKVSHMIKIHNLPPVDLKCKACPRSFANKRALTRHVNKDHLMERRHVCDICPMSFYLKHHLRDHLTIHTGEKKFQCHICFKNYGTKKSLSQHQRSHAEDRSYSCGVCGEDFFQMSILRCHIKAKH